MKATKKAVKRARPTLTEVKALHHELARKSFNLEQLAAALGESKERLAAVENLASTDIQGLRKSLESAQNLIRSKQIDLLKCDTKLSEATAMIENRNRQLEQKTKLLTDATAEINSLALDLVAAREKAPVVERQSWASRFLKRWR